MQSVAPGINASVEVLGITANGIWLFAAGEEHFLPYEHFPWFKQAAVADVFTVEPSGKDALHWPALDVDLTLDMIRHPDKYPLTASLL